VVIKTWKKMKIKLLLFFLSITIAAYGQDIVVEKISLTETVDNSYVSEIPRVRDRRNENNQVVEKINAQILDRFMINSFEQGELEEFRWYDVTTDSQIKGNILHISFAGEYYGAYPNYVEDEFYFDLTSGTPLEQSKIPFQALFTLSGYLDFVSTYWLEGVKSEFKEAVACADYEPYCSYYDIANYSVENNNLSISLTDDCYARVSRACSPHYGISVELEAVKPYLNDLGRHILLESDYLTLSPIDKFMETEKLKAKIQNNLFLFGKVGDKYPMSIALSMDEKGQVSGYYYYDKKRQKLALNGQKRGDIIAMTETYDNKQTGYLELKFSNTFKPEAFYLYSPDDKGTYVTGKWTNVEKSKEFDVSFSEVKRNNN
jgi:hypothetical protein